MKSSDKQTEKTGNKSNGIIKKMIVAIALIFTVGSTFAADHYRGRDEQQPYRNEYRDRDDHRWYRHIRRDERVEYRYQYPVYQPVWINGSYCR